MPLGGARIKGLRSPASQEIRDGNIQRIKAIWKIESLDDIIPKEIRPAKELGDSTVSNIKAMACVFLMTLAEFRETSKELCTVDGLYREFRWVDSLAMLNKLKSKGPPCAKKTLKRKANEDEDTTTPSPPKKRARSEPTPSPPIGKQTCNPSLKSVSTTKKVVKFDAVPRAGTALGLGITNFSDFFDTSQLHSVVPGPEYSPPKRRRHWRSPWSPHCRDPAPDEFSPFIPPGPTIYYGPVMPEPDVDVDVEYLNEYLNEYEDDDEDDDEEDDEDDDGGDDSDNDDGISANRSVRSESDYIGTSPTLVNTSPAFIEEPKWSTSLLYSPFKSAAKLSSSFPLTKEKIESSPTPSAQRSSPEIQKILSAFTASSIILSITLDVMPEEGDLNLKCRDAIKTAKGVLSAQRAAVVQAFKDEGIDVEKVMKREVEE